MALGVRWWRYIPKFRRIEMIAPSRGKRSPTVNRSRKTTTSFGRGVGVVSEPGAQPFPYLMKQEVTNSATSASETLIRPKTKVGGALSAFGTMETEKETIHA
jgi:hypothetical protein